VNWKISEDSMKISKSSKISKISKKEIPEIPKVPEKKGQRKIGCMII